MSGGDVVSSRGLAKGSVGPERWKGVSGVVCEISGFLEVDSLGWKV